jgi:hypothetical protein
MTAKAMMIRAMMSRPLMALPTPLPCERLPKSDDEP